MQMITNTGAHWRKSNFDVKHFDFRKRINFHPRNLTFADESKKKFDFLQLDLI